MFPAARCSVPLRPQPRGTMPCRRWPCRRAPAPTAVSAKPRRWSRGPRRDRSWDEDGGGDGSGSDADVDDGFFGTQDLDDEEPEREDLAPARPAPTGPAGGQLRGSDVLRALQRAAAAKEAAAAKKKRDGRPAALKRQGKEKLKEGAGVEAVGEVRPLVIKPEWAARIRELELRLQQLADKYHQ